MTSNRKSPSTPQSEWEKFQQSQREQRDDGWKELIHQMSLESTKHREQLYSYHYKKKVDESLWMVGNYQLANRIDNCVYHPKHMGTIKSGEVCKSPWCLGCRNRLYQRHYQKVVDRLQHGKHTLEQYEITTPLISGSTLTTTELRSRYEETQFTNNDLKHITGVVGVCEFNKWSVQNLIEDDYKRWRRIRRRLNKITGEVCWIEAVYELELVDWRKLRDSNGSEIKKKQMDQLIKHMGIDEISKQNPYRFKPFVFVHWHGITNLTNEQLVDVFKKDYWVGSERLIKTTGDHGLYVQSLHKNKSLEQNIQRITSYPFKNPTRFKHTYIGSDYRNGEFFTPNELGEFITLYDEFIGRAGRQLFRSLGNDAEVWWEVNERLIEVCKGEKIRTESMRKLSHNIQKMLIDIRKKGGGNMKGTLTPYINSVLVRNKMKNANWLYWKFQPVGLVGWEKEWNKKMTFLKDPHSIELPVSEQKEIYKEMGKKKERSVWEDDTLMLRRIMKK